MYEYMGYYYSLKTTIMCQTDVNRLTSQQDSQGSNDGDDRQGTQRQAGRVGPAGRMGPVGPVGTPGEPGPPGACTCGRSELSLEEQTVDIKGKFLCCNVSWELSGGFFRFAYASMQMPRFGQAIYLGTAQLTYKFDIDFQSILTHIVI